MGIAESLMDWDEDELKQWMRDNLRINIEYVQPCGPGNSVYIGLYFVGTQKEVFSNEMIYLPSNDAD